ncbi:hypothetical protein [Clostridium phage Villandry]|nr:hypothetical protein [Clostridium phage Villandry]
MGHNKIDNISRTVIFTSCYILLNLSTVNSGT